MHRLGVFRYQYVGLIASLLAALGCPVSQAADKRQYGGEYRAPLVSEPTSLDPAYYTDIYAMKVATNLFDGLVEFDANLKFIKVLARKWKIS